MGIKHNCVSCCIKWVKRCRKPLDDVYPTAIDVEGKTAARYSRQQPPLRHAKMLLRLIAVGQNRRLECLQLKLVGILYMLQYMPL